MAGPPCETWSVARFRALLDALKPGPRPLRSQAQPWGLTCLKKSEANSVTLGNALLRATIRMFYAALCNPDCAVIMEHPRCPTWVPEAPSSWLLPELAYIASLSAARVLDVDQCMFGAPSKKPTTLLCLNALHLEPFESAPLVCCHTSHEVILTGKDEHGNFRTAPAKQYPGGLCGALAGVAVGQFLGIARRNPPPPPRLNEFEESVLSKFYIPSDPYLNSSNSFGADCSTSTGTYGILPPLPNGKEEIAAKALAEAHAASVQAMTCLFGLPNGSALPDKRGHLRLLLRP